MAVRVGTWNVNFRGGAAARGLGRPARATDVDLLPLQEANPAALDDLAEAAGMEWVISAFDAGHPPL